MRIKKENGTYGQHLLNIKVKITQTSYNLLHFILFFYCLKNYDFIVDQLNFLYLD